MAGVYSDKVMDHFMHPRNVGEIKDPDGIGKVGNPVCGDIMEMYIKVKDNVITDIKFKTFGCGAAIATSSMATEMIKGKTIEEALKLTNKAVAESLDGLPPVKMHCSVLAEDAVKGAIDDYLKKSTGVGLQGWSPRSEIEEHGH
ncbi:MAG: Fe-S cluster assembly scaffold protein NifU [Candidatus Margulisiibacteriota bacterium]